MDKIKLNEELYNIAVDFRVSDVQKRTEILKNENFTSEEIIQMAEMQYIFIRDFDGIPRDILGKFCDQESMAAQDGLFLGRRYYATIYGKKRLVINKKSPLHIYVGGFYVTIKHLDVTPFIWGKVSL